MQPTRLVPATIPLLEPRLETERSDSESASVPEVPADYYRRIREIETNYWWHRGIREITAALLDGRLTSARSLLDAGCGTGGFLRWARERGSFESLVGADLSAEAIELAREQVPSAKFHVAPIWSMPLESEAFDLVVTNDVIQHVVEPRVEESLRELRRVLRGDGTLLIKTNGARRFRRDGEEWRVYDRDALAEALRSGGFRCERVTYANVVGSLWAAARGYAPHAPTSEHHGVPSDAGSFTSNLKYGLLKAEARWLRRPSRSLPYGHALFALALPA
jgi:SAM-dependent methyltransferase